MKRGLLVDDHSWFRQTLTLVLEQHTDLKVNVQAGSLAEADWMPSRSVSSETSTRCGGGGGASAAFQS